MTSLKALTATAVFAVALQTGAAQALVLPSTANAVARLDATIEIEGGTIAVIGAPSPFSDSETTGPGPNTAIGTNTASLVSSIDVGCVTPTFGCVLDYDVSADVSALNGSASATETIGQTTFEVVVESSAVLTITVEEAFAGASALAGTGLNPIGAASAIINEITFDGQPFFAFFATGSSEMLDLDTGIYSLVIGELSAIASASQTIEVPAPASLALLGFGLIALGGIRRRA